MRASMTDPLFFGQAALSRWVIAEALGLGFSVSRIADVTAPWAASDRLEAWLAAGHHGSMDWMAVHAARRSHPRALWPDAVSAVVIGQNYGPADNPLDRLAQTNTAAISAYAQGSDYHDLMKGRLKQLAGRFAAKTGAQVKVFVDTAPLMEKPLAERAGVGWQGKHTNLVSREWGSWLFLGAMLTDAELIPDTPETDHCGTCRACLDICPTAAFPAPYQLDARRCLAYLSIEHKGPIPAEFRAAMGNRVYGCDDCLAVCPWNKFAAATGEARLAARDALTGVPLSDLLCLDDAGFRALFAGTAVKRIGRARFVRNVAIAVGNSREPAHVPALLSLLADPEPLVRGAAIWALARLDPNRWAAEKQARAAVEPDPSVVEEWHGAPEVT
jgi:epoxyqueuosine reductase